MLGTIKEIIAYREMLKNMVVKELRQRYKGSILGFLWTFLNPFLMLVVYSLVFSTIMRIDMDNYSYFLFAGLLPWMFFSNSILISAGVVVQNSNLIKKIYFPREILPISVTLSGLVNYILSFIILIPAMLIFKIQPTEAIIVLPVVIIIQLVMVMGFSLWIAGLNVYFRDLEHILSVFLMAWFYLTPIIYPLRMIPEKYLMLINLNPVAPIMIAYQDILYYGVFPEWTYLGYDLLFSIILLFTGLVVYGRLKRNFAEEI